MNNNNNRLQVNLKLQQADKYINNFTMVRLSKLMIKYAWYSSSSDAILEESIVWLREVLW